MTTLSIVFSVATLFVALFPRVMVSSLDPSWSLTIYNASSTPYTLGIMSIVAAVFVPIVLAYQGWTYWVFRHRITAETRLEY
jgi:cytochrome d ubiquinol oxidase subunit II